MIVGARCTPSYRTSCRRRWDSTRSHSDRGSSATSCFSAVSIVHSGESPRVMMPPYATVDTGRWQPHADLGAPALGCGVIRSAVAVEPKLISTVSKFRFSFPRNSVLSRFLDYFATVCLVSGQKCALSKNRAWCSSEYERIWCKTGLRPLCGRYLYLLRGVYV